MSNSTSSLISFDSGLQQLLSISAPKKRADYKVAWLVVEVIMIYNDAIDWLP